MRIPPVFEMTPDDIPHLRRLAARASVLVSQPVRDDYRELPVGTNQLAAMMPAGSAVVRWPVVRFAGFHPWQVIIRDPADASQNPPVVPYHDLRTVAAAAGLAEDGLPSTAALATARELSRAELARREQRDCDVAVSDLFDAPQHGDMLTINHPGNRVLLELAHRIQAALGVPTDAADPGRTLLGEVVAPIEQLTLDALGIPGNGTTDWQVGGRTVDAQTVRQAQRAWYRDNPRVVQAGRQRHAALLDLLGFS